MRMSTLIGRTENRPTMGEAFELLMRWWDRHPGVSQKAAARLWETLGVLLCPRDVQWPIVKKLQVCRKQCKLGLYWRDREQLNACASCDRSRTTALTFYYRWFLVIPPILVSRDTANLSTTTTTTYRENLL
eukprot:g47938.t1